VYSPQEYIALRDLAGIFPYMPEEKASIANGQSTNWQDLMYENGFTTDNNLTVAGGSAGNTWSLGGGYYKETTVLPGQDFKRFSLRATIDAKVGSRFKHPQFSA
jgi:hypothetical protein